MADLPRWKSHKIVQADKVRTYTGETWELEASGQVIQVSPGLRSRVPPSQSPTDGYYVRYDDGYESWSPAKAFEEGYERLPSPGASAAVLVDIKVQGSDGTQIPISFLVTNAEIQGGILGEVMRNRIETALQQINKVLDAQG